MYSLSYGKVNQADTPGLLALVALAILLPGSAWAAKSETGNGCCPGYEKNEVNSKYFNRFQRSYKNVPVCGSQQAAVMFKLQGGDSVCVDPQKAWAKLLMKRIDKATRNQHKPARDDQPQRQSSASDTRATKPPTSGSPTSRAATSTGQGPSSDHADSTQGHGETSAHPQQGEAAGTPTTEDQIGTRPAMPVGDANTPSSTRALGSLPFTPTTAVVRETTWRTTTSVEPQATRNQHKPARDDQPQRQSSASDTRATKPPTTGSPTSRAATSTGQGPSSDHADSTQGRSSRHSNYRGPNWHSPSDACGRHQHTELNAGTGISPIHPDDSCSPGDNMENHNISRTTG
ncbi:uncharacterized protein LOC144677232, partial [Cetorhinus maximus]